MFYPTNHCIATIAFSKLEDKHQLHIASYLLITGDFFCKAEVSDDCSITILIGLDQAVLR